MKFLETNFGNGENFLRHWRDWRDWPVHGTQRRPVLLHYVAVVTQPIDFKSLEQTSNAQDRSAELAHQLAAQCDGLEPGFHRLMFESGKVLLTLCVGDLKSQLKALQFEADALLLADSPFYGNPDSPWDIWAVKSLAKCCRRGTTLTCVAPSPELLIRLTQCGFEITQRLIKTKGFAEFLGCFNPQWEPKHSRASAIHRGIPRKPGHCMVIGAGLAGASVAASMARRGWKVTVLDAAAQPAMGASGLPVGLMVPHTTADDSLRSRLSRRGMRLALQQAATLLTPGQDWCGSGVLERRLQGALGLPPDWLQAGADGRAAWTRPVTEDNTTNSQTWRHGLPSDDFALWHSKAAWIKPARLVQAWLAQPGIQFQGNVSVASLSRSDHQWVASNTQGQPMAAADLVVIANASGAMPLLARLKATLPHEHLIASALGQLQTVEGQVSWAMHGQGDSDAHHFPPFPVNGLGSLTAQVPIDGQRAWFAGATFERSGEALGEAAGHQANLERLMTLVPASGKVFAEQLAQHNVKAWRSTRCTSNDRMPLCGPLLQGDRDLQPTLWLVSALGARGLSLAVLCAELLAARVNHEPLPIEAPLALAMRTDRQISSKSLSNIDS